MGAIMNQKCNQIIKLISTLTLIGLLSSCGGESISANKWSQFHADGQSQGFTAVNSSPAVKPLWKRDVGPVAHSSPVLASDGTIHLGTTDGELVIVNPDGTIKCSVDLSTGVILSTPAIASNGNVYIVSTIQIESGSHLSTLHSVTPDCGTRWSYTFPDVNVVIRGHTSASPKVMESNRGIHIFIPVRLSRMRDSDDNDDLDDGLNELFVFDDRGGVIDRRTIGGCVSVTGGGSDISGTLSDIWDFIINFPPNSTSFLGDAFGPLYEQFGWLDPTAALVDLSTITTPRRPLVIVADNCFGLRMTGFHWQLDMANPALARVWTYDSKSRKRNYSSPAVFNNGLLVIGREDGEILAFDPETGTKLWDQNVGEAVMATPASFGRQIFLNSLHRLHVLEANGEFADVPAVSTIIGGQTIASPAVSANFVYYGTTAGFLTRSFDFYTRANDTDAIGGVSSPAISPDGIVYNVIIEGGTSHLMAYPARAQPQTP